MTPIMAEDSCLTSFIEQIVVPCTPELTSLLACFATSGDLQHKAECSAAAKNLHKCMETRPKNSKGRKSEVSRKELPQRSYRHRLILVGCSGQINALLSKIK